MTHVRTYKHYIQYIVQKLYVQKLRFCINSVFVISFCKQEEQSLAIKQTDPIKMYRSNKNKRYNLSYFSESIVQSRDGCHCFFIFVSKE